MDNNSGWSDQDMTEFLIEDLREQLKTNTKTFDQLEFFLDGKNPFGRLIKNRNTLKTNSGTVGKMIRRSRYKEVNSAIVERFSPLVLTPHVFEFRFIETGKLTHFISVKKLCEKGGWQAGKIEHLLAVSAAFPGIQRSQPVTALGSVCEIDGCKYSPEIVGGFSERHLDLMGWGNDLDPSDRFLSVREVKNT